MHTKNFLLSRSSWSNLFTMCGSRMTRHTRFASAVMRLRNMSSAARQKILTVSRVTFIILLFSLILAGSGKLFLEFKETVSYLFEINLFW